jgi:pimeloyl-ACP methyl ester carboxylesterase
MIDPLVSPAASGSQSEQAFHLVIPSLPGYGFSTPVSEKGWEISKMAKAFDQIMGQLGYDAIKHGAMAACGQLSICRERVIGS